MNTMKLTGKALALVFAAGIAAAALSACGDEKKTDEPAQTGTTTVQPQTTEQPQAQPQTQDAQDDLGMMDMKPATEAEVLECLAFLPDPLATVDGDPIPRKMIIDDIVSQEIPLTILKSIGEERLRQAMQKQIEAIVKEKVMLKLAEKAGFKPSPEIIVQEMKEEFDELPDEGKEEIEEMLKARKLTFDEYVKETSENPEIQKIAALRRYTHTTFLDKAKKELTDAEIQKEYDAHVEELRVPEGITVAHILIQPEEEETPADADADAKAKAKADADAKAKAKIDAIYEELIKDPAAFDKLAQEKSDCPSGKRDNGKLPAFDKDGYMLDGSGAMDQTFTDAAFAIEKDGQITKPVKTQFGYHIIRRIEKTPESVIPIEKVKDRIVEHLVEKKAQEDLDKAIDDAIEKSNIKYNDFAPAKEAPAEK